MLSCTGHVASVVGWVAGRTVTCGGCSSGGHEQCLLLGQSHAADPPWVVAGWLFLSQFQGSCFFHVCGSRPLLRGLVAAATHCVVKGWPLIAWSWDSHPSHHHRQQPLVAYHMLWQLHAWSWVASAPRVSSGSHGQRLLVGQLLLTWLWGGCSSGGHGVAAPWVGGAEHCFLCGHGWQLLAWLLEWSWCLGLLCKAQLFTHAVTAPGAAG